jgi:hypothetical protein
MYVSLKRRTVSQERWNGVENGGTVDTVTQSIDARAREVYGNGVSPLLRRLLRHRRRRWPLPPTIRIIGRGVSLSFPPPRCHRPKTIREDDDDDDDDDEDDEDDYDRRRAIVRTAIRRSIAVHHVGRTAAVARRDTRLPSTYGIGGSVRTVAVGTERRTSFPIPGEGGTIRHVAIVPGDGIGHIAHGGEVR